MKNLISFLLLIACTGCAFVATLPYDPAIKGNFTLTDACDPSDKTKELLSYSISSCQYGILRQADERTNPPRIEFLRNTLAKAQLPRLSGKEIIVKKFTVYENGRRSAHDTAVGASGGGILGLAIASILVPGSCEQPLDKGGYTTTENPNNDGIVVLELVLSIDGKEYPVRSTAIGNSNPETLIERGFLKLASDVTTKLASAQ
ncbi:MAG TPA: hypothetical protein VLC92_09980 [Rhodocyclaceae bacterium]|nr:hypothetical protein [Rhodocyclaceae bacterium]